ncbi:MAG: hypothetical protein WBO24_17170, partial [Nitrospirales bacterium]
MGTMEVCRSDDEWLALFCYKKGIDQAGNRVVLIQQNPIEWMILVAGGRPCSSHHRRIRRTT